jgi:hypothetical protein
MPKFVKVQDLIAAPILEMVEVIALPEKDRGPDDLPYRVTFDTPVDGHSGVISVDISESRAIELGIVERPDAGIGDE